MPRESVDVYLAAVESRERWDDRLEAESDRVDRDTDEYRENFKPAAPLGPRPAATSDAIQERKLRMAAALRIINRAFGRRT